jgi:thiamine pyrophosphokinase
MQDPLDALPIAFSGILVIVGGGAVDAHLLHRLHAQGAHIVGADGGGDVIAEAGLVPEAIIGDLDSLADPDGWPIATKVIRIPEQITTDFQKTIYSTQAPITIALGMTGKRFDHTLAALSAVTEYARARKIILVDEFDLAIALSGPFGFTIKAGERVSIHPLLPVDFTSSTGLLYPLDGLRLAPGELIGTSNAAVDGPVEIIPTDDTPWLLILEKSHLWTLIDAIEALEQ